jgi:signal transduction histidine kinase
MLEIGRSLSERSPRPANGGLRKPSGRAQVALSTPRYSPVSKCIDPPRASTLATFLASWLLARGALRPVSVLTATASSIARARRFSKRVAAGPRKDELGQLALTFNEMLNSLEQAYRAELRFVGDASHELRGPLTAIQANLDLIERRRCLTCRSEPRSVVCRTHQLPRDIRHAPVASGDGTLGPSEGNGPIEA